MHLEFVATWGQGVASANSKKSDGINRRFFKATNKLHLTAQYTQ